MSFRKKLEDKITKKKEENREFEAKINAGKAYISGLQEALKLAPKEEDIGIRAKQLLRPGSFAFLAQRFLIQHGRPAHVADILTGINKANNKKNRTVISGALSTYVRDDKIFTRTGPNIFGLVEMEDSDFQSKEDIQEDTPQDEIIRLPIKQHGT